MILLTMSIFFVLSLLLSSNLPFNTILFLISITIFCSIKMSLYFSASWLMMIVILLFVGGLMIIYIFIMSMNSNMPMKEKYPMIISIPFIVSMLYMNKDYTMNSKNTGSFVFSSSWWYLFMMMITILICMMLMSKIIIFPMKPSKKMK